jgi:hypothetical protein
MNEFLNCSRRDFLRLAGVGALGAAAAPALPASGAGVGAKSAVVVHDPDFAVPAEFAAGLGRTSGGGAVPLIALRGDPVRLWRDGLRETVVQGGALYGLTLWADLVIFQGLASELRRHVRVVREDAATGRFAWMIA